MNSFSEEKALEMIQNFIEEKSGIVIGEDKRYLLESKLSKMLAESGTSSFEDLYAKICGSKDPDIVENVIDAITINETYWFRDRTPWRILREVLLPAYINEIKEGKRDKVRIWSAACSYGQEPYSIAMCIDRYLQEKMIIDVTLDHFEITATDISQTALLMAEAGAFDSISISRGLEDHYKYSYFHNKGRIWSINETIRSRIHFRKFNLIHDGCMPESFDIIFCRYVLIYFSEKCKRKVTDNIALALKNRGVLFIGSSELMDQSDISFTTEQYEDSIFFRKRGVL